MGTVDEVLPDGYVILGKNHLLGSYQWFAVQMLTGVEMDEIVGKVMPGVKGADSIVSMWDGIRVDTAVGDNVSRKQLKRAAKELNRWMDKAGFSSASVIF